MSGVASIVTVLPGTWVPLLWASWCRVTGLPGTLITICPPNTSSPFTNSLNPGTGTGVAVGLAVGIGVGEGVGVNVAVGSGSKQIATSSRSRSMITAIVLEFRDAPWGTLRSQAPNAVEHWAVTTTSLPSGHRPLSLKGRTVTLPRLAGSTSVSSLYFTTCLGVGTGIAVAAGTAMGVDVGGVAVAVGSSVGDGVDVGGGSGVGTCSGSLMVRANTLSWSTCA